MHTRLFLHTAPVQSIPTAQLCSHPTPVPPALGLAAPGSAAVRGRVFPPSAVERTSDSRHGPVEVSPPVRSVFRHVHVVILGHVVARLALLPLRGLLISLLQRGDDDALPDAHVSGDTCGRHGDGSWTGDAAVRTGGGGVIKPLSGLAIMTR